MIDKFLELEALILTDIRRANTPTTFTTAQKLNDLLLELKDLMVAIVGYSAFINKGKND
jgi:hypothetical protein